MVISNVSRITAAVRKIPRGKVATYGQIARLAGVPRNARQVGTVLRNLPHESKIPWHRVVNSKGGISERGHGSSEQLQRYVLETEGVDVSDEQRVDLKSCQWKKDLPEQSTDDE